MIRNFPLKLARRVLQKEVFKGRTQKNGSQEVLPLLERFKRLS